MTNENVTKTKPRKRKSKAGIIILVIIVLILGAGAALYFRVPQKIGLIKSPAEQLFTVTPDEEKAAAVMENLKLAGLNTRGVEVYVLPVSGTDHNVAMIVLDASKGFDLKNYPGADPVKDFLAVVSKAQQQGINRAAVAFYDEAGKPLVTATISADAVVAYFQKKLTDRQLMEKVDIGAEDLPALIAQFQQQIK